ncbi:MAG TPA: amidophosphoribosyltransferase [Alphaproteobacteria bacterium]|nr:amidophosphoribosyltransferase [Alphaproteobacteria bacterium]
MNLKEKCGIFGIYSNEPDVARLVYYGLWALQHRGQENSGIASSNGRKIFCHKGKGLVAHVYDENDLKKLKGNIAIGHNRYSTFGKSDIDHSQPVYDNQNTLALAHNGNLPQVHLLKKFLKTKGISTHDLNDSELMYKAIEYYLVKGKSAIDAVKLSFPLFTGAFSLLVMTKNELIAVRDEFGIRPLCLGRINGSFIFASETCALDAVGATFVRDIEPAEMIVINKNGLTSYKLAEGKEKLDIFEFIYFARPDSVLMGKSIYQVRKNLGIELAREVKIKADMIIPIPDSAIPSAIGFSSISKIPVEQVLVKNRYIHRTFIKPAQKQRATGVKMKLNLIKEAVKGKRVILIDDSIVRGTTSKMLVDLVRSAEPKEVHMLVSSPPVKYPDFYGIDTPNQKDLIAANMSLGELTKYIGVDSLHYLSFKGLIKAIGIEENKLCTSCFTGNYPIDIGSKIKKINKL